MFLCRFHFLAGAAEEEKMPGVLGGVFLHYAGEAAEAGRCAIIHAETDFKNHNLGLLFFLFLRLKHLTRFIDYFQILIAVCD